MIVSFDFAYTDRARFDALIARLTAAGASFEVRSFDNDGPAGGNPSVEILCEDRASVDAFRDFYFGPADRV
jgi:hypothetical protein